MSAIDLAYTLKQKVLIIDIDTKATIDSILYSIDGIQYRVTFWIDNVRKVEWVYPHEIKSIQTTKAI